MPRLIDADAVCKAIDDAYGTGNVIELKKVVAKIPTAETVRSAKWLAYDGMRPPELSDKHYCSNCYGYAPHDRGFRERLSPWCPGCGAFMDNAEQT